MSTIEQKLYTSLTTNSDITNLTSLRIYPVAIPESTDFPCISYQVISNRHISDLNHSKPTLEFKRIQLNIWSENYEEVKTLEEYSLEAIYNGDIKGHIENSRDLVDKELKLFGVSLDLIASNK